MRKDTSVTTADRSNPRVPVVIFGIGIAVLVLYMLTFPIGLRGENDFYKEAWPAYLLLDHGHILAFLRDGPGYVGSLILRAPFRAPGRPVRRRRTGHVPCHRAALCGCSSAAGWLVGTEPAQAVGNGRRRARPRIRPP